MSQILKQLKEYFAKTPKEQIDKDWQEIEAMGLQGMTICEFIENQKKHDIMETKQMTNEQKAVKIATYDGWVSEVGNDFYIKNNNGNNRKVLTYNYLTDLNYLVPVAVKVRDELARIADPFNSEDKGFDIWINLDKKYTQMTKTPSNTYQPLFDAVHEAIVYLENQNA
jgi:predicted RNase H-like nuclease (RuvC/YqgF family)